MILCSSRYCGFPPKYITNSIHASRKNGIPLMCGICLNTRKNWLDPWSSFVEVEELDFIEISQDEYMEGVELKFYKLTKEKIQIIKELVV